MNNPCAEIPLPFQYTVNFEIGDRLSYKVNGNYATIYDIRHNDYNKLVYFRTPQGREGAMEWNKLIILCEETDITLIKKTYLPEELFTI